MKDRSRLILASRSPRRLELLNKIGFPPVEIIPADIDETPKKKENPLDYVQRIAIEKAESVRERMGVDDASKHFILSADTVAVVGTKILGKPDDREHAKKIIRTMSGKKHKVLTSICVIAPDGTKRKKTVITQVKFKNIDNDELEEYLDTNQWEGKAGAYGLQRDTGAFVISINGSYSNVIGLPAYETKNMLLGLGFKK